MPFRQLSIHRAQAPSAMPREGLAKAVLGLLIGGLLLAWQPARAAPDAAALDWVPRNKLPPSRRAQLPPYCSGAYLQPSLPPLPPAARPLGSGAMPVWARSDQAHYDRFNSTLWLQGNVEVRQGSFQVKAPAARYDEKAGSIRIQGPLVSRGKGVLLTGDSGEYRTGDGYFQVNTASFLIHAADMRGNARQINRSGTEQIDIHNGSMTTCGPGRNDWSLVASKIHLNRKEGFGTATNVRLHVEDVPVFYFPYISFPIDKRRKSGFLYPAFGTSNTGRGMFVAVPYYFNLAPAYDMTYTPQYINGRGLLSELEGRYLNRYGESVMSLGYIGHDSQYTRDNPGQNGKRWAFGFTNQSRYSQGWSSSIDYSAVSDDNYLSDLNRNLKLNRTTNLARTGSLTYTSRNLYFEGLVNGYQVLDSNLPQVNKPYDQLPELLLSTDWQKGLFSFSSDSQYDYFYRRNDQITGLARSNGSRVRFLPKAGLDLDTSWGYLRPSVLMDLTHYSLTDYPGDNSEINRAVPFYQLDSGLFFDRQLQLFGSRYDQSLEPRLYYVYSPFRDQTRIPLFDTALNSFNFDQLFARDRFSGGDRIGDNNRVTLAVTTRFNDLDSGAERARFSLGRIYYFNRRQLTLSGTSEPIAANSPLAGEAQVRPTDNLDLSLSGEWDPKTRSLVQSNAELGFHSADYRYILNMGQFYQRAGTSGPALHQSDLNGVMPLTNRLSAIGRWVYDSVSHKTVGTLAGLEYTTCCWNLQLVHQGYLTANGELDNRILFQVRLKGLGSGGGAVGQLDQAIYGFSEREKRLYRNAGGFGALP